MPRLGRGRRNKPIILRGKSVTTPTPLVRRRTLITNNAAERAVQVATRFKRHPLRKFKARSTTTVVASVRKRQVVTNNAAERAVQIATRFKRHPVRKFKARSVTTPTPASRKRTIVVQNGDYLSRRIASSFRRHKAIIISGSRVAPIPYVSKKIVVTRGGNERSRYRATFYRRRIAEILRPKIAWVKPARAITADTQVSRRVAYFKRHKAFVGRNRTFPAPLGAGRQPIIRRNPRAALVTALRGRGITRLQRAPSVPTVIGSRGRQPIVRRDTKAVILRALSNRGITPVIRGRSVPTPTPLVRKRLFMQPTRRRLVAFRRHPAKFIRPQSVRGLPESKRHVPLIVGNKTSRLRRACQNRGRTTVYGPHAIKPPVVVRTRTVHRQNWNTTTRYYHASRNRKNFRYYRSSVIGSANQVVITYHNTGTIEHGSAGRIEHETEGSIVRHP